MKISKLFAAVVMVGALTVSSAYAADFGVRVGKGNDIDEEFVGAEALIGLGSSGFVFNPNIEYYLTDDGTVGTLNGDFLYRFGTASAFRPWVGAGVGLFHAEDGDFESDETAVNVLGGVGYKFATLEPYVQVKYLRLTEESEADDLSVAVGLRF